MTVTNGAGQSVGGGNWCTASSTSEFSCTAYASCQGGGYFGGSADVGETNADGYSTEETWTYPTVWVTC